MGRTSQISSVSLAKMTHFFMTDIDNTGDRQGQKTEVTVLRVGIHPTKIIAMGQSSLRRGQPESVSRSVVFLRNGIV